jgi:hypothetical protein
MSDAQGTLNVYVTRAELAELLGQLLQMHEADHGLILELRKQLLIIAADVDRLAAQVQRNLHSVKV